MVGYFLCLFGFTWCVLSRLGDGQWSVLVIEDLDVGV